MKLEVYIFCIVLYLIFSTVTFCQTPNWQNLVALESNRSEVERILGKPTQSFDTYGIYETSFGKFHIWYSSGKCQKNVRGRQWDVPAGKLAHILLYPGQPTILPTNVKETYRREVKSGDELRSLYFSPDESITYQTIKINEEAKEIVETIDIQPSKDKQKFLCKAAK